MASSIEQSPFFQQQKSKGEIVVKGMMSVFPVAWGRLLTVVDPPKFDLESYIANYTGMHSALAYGI